MKLNQYFLLIIAGVTLVAAASCKKNDPKPAAVDKGPKPDSIWKEHFPLMKYHNQTLTLAYYDQEVVIYKDPGVEPSITWPYELMSRVWKYAKSVYGPMGKDPRLYVVLHGGTYGEIGQPLYYFDPNSEYRNVVDFSTGNWNSWYFSEPGLIHEVCHVVESTNNNVAGSPAFPVWGDSKWQDIFIYDVYRALGMTDKVAAWQNFYQESTVKYPMPNSHWYRDWWIPIYNKYGESKVLSKFFVLLSQNFPTHHIDNPVIEKQYDRDLNFGEYVHFTSGAAGVNLKAQAAIAFGWTDEFEAQFQQAQKDFPNVKYSE